VFLRCETPEDRSRSTVGAGQLKPGGKCASRKLRRTEAISRKISIAGKRRRFRRWTALRLHSLEMPAASRQIWRSQSQLSILPVRMQDRPVRQRTFSISFPFTLRSSELRAHSFRSIHPELQLPNMVLTAAFQLRPPDFSPTSGVIVTALFLGSFRNNGGHL
jgi:hypothetical protein